METEKNEARSGGGIPRLHFRERLEPEDQLLSRRLMRATFGLRIMLEDIAVDYAKYSFVIRASIRKAIVREMDLLERRNPHGIRVSRLRKALNERRPTGVNPLSHAVRDLIKARVPKSLPISATRTRQAFRLAYVCRKILSEMNR